MSQVQQAASAASINPMAGSETAAWHPVCAIEDIWPNMGVCALVEGRQIVIFRLQDNQLYAMDNHDPHSNANVLSRGIIGDLNGERVVASPIYKQHYQVQTGVCVEDPAVYDSFGL